MFAPLEFNVFDFDATEIKDFDLKTDDAEFRIRDIKVYYKHNLNGGGSLFGQDFVPLMKTLYPNKKFQTVFEWCSGPGFIGFALLANDMCNNLYLGDIHQPALDCCLITKAHLPEKYQNNTVETIKMSSPADIDASLKFDLIVSNPPHFNRSQKTYNTDAYWTSRLFADEDWSIHKNFFLNIKKNLTADGVIILQESFFGSGPDTFNKMIDDAGLKITRYIDTNRRVLYPVYYLEIMHK
jgi:methylase of polypeptide subunit release factors